MVSWLYIRHRHFALFDIIKRIAFCGLVGPTNPVSRGVVKNADRWVLCYGHWITGAENVVRIITTKRMR